jgi:hypothetical protein
MDWYADIVATIALALSGRAFLQERKAKLEPTVGVHLPEPVEDLAGAAVSPA